MGASCCKKRQMFSSKYGELLIESNNDSTKKSIPVEKANLCVNENDLKDDLSVNSLSVQNRTYSFEKGHKLIEENSDRAETYIRINRNVLDRNNSFYSTIGNDLDSDKKQVTINSKNFTSIDKEIPDIKDCKIDLSNNLQTFENLKENSSLIKTLPNRSDEDFNEPKIDQQFKDVNKKYPKIRKELNKNFVVNENINEGQVTNIINNYQKKEIPNSKDFSEEERLFENKDDRMSENLVNLKLKSNSKEEKTDNCIYNISNIIKNNSLNEENPYQNINKYSISNENDKEYDITKTTFKNNNDTKDETFHQEQNKIIEENPELSENACIIYKNLKNILVNMNEESKLEKCDTNISIVEKNNHNLQENLYLSNNNSSALQRTLNSFKTEKDENNTNFSANNNSNNLHNNMTENTRIVNISDIKDNLKLNEDNENSK